MDKASSRVTAYANNPPPSKQYSNSMRSAGSGSAGSKYKAGRAGSADDRGSRNRYGHPDLWLAAGRSLTPILTHHRRAKATVTAELLGFHFLHSDALDRPPSPKHRRGRGRDREGSLTKAQFMQAKYDTRHSTLDTDTCA